MCNKNKIVFYFIYTKALLKMYIKRIKINNMNTYHINYCKVTAAVILI